MNAARIGTAIGETHGSALSGNGFATGSQALQCDLQVHEKAQVGVGAGRIAAALRVSVVIPTLNEAENIGWVLDRLPPGLHEVILVDGYSTDNTIVVAQQIRPDIRVVMQASRGKGLALACGLAQVTGDIAIMIDADGSMDPAEMPGLIGALLSGADVAKGSRLSAGGGSVDMTPIRRFGNSALTILANRVYQSNWRELCYGYAAFWCDVLPLLGIFDIATAGSGQYSQPPLLTPARAMVRVSGIDYGHGFEIEAILFCRAARLGLRVAEVFSFEHERRYGVSNLATWRDGWRVLYAIIRERRYRPSRSFLDRQKRSYPITPHLLDKHHERLARARSGAERTCRQLTS